MPGQDASHVSSTHDAIRSSDPTAGPLLSRSVPLPVQDTPLRTGPFPRNSDVGETWAPPQQQRTSNSGSASRQSLSLHRRAPSKGFVAEVGGSPLFSSSLFASVFNLSAPLTPTANNASSAGRASPGDLDLAAIGALMGDDGFHAGTPPADGAGLTGPSPGGGRNFSPGQRGPGELSAEAVPFQATRPRVSPPRWEYAEYGYGVGHGGGGGGEHQQWPMPPRIPAEKPQPPPRPAVVPPLDFSGLSKGGGAEGAVGWVEGGGMVGHGQWGTYVVPPYVPAPPARPKGKGKGKKESGEAEGKRKEEGEKDGGGKEESEGAGRRGEGEDGVAGERGGDCSTGEKDQSD